MKYSTLKTLILLSPLLLLPTLWLLIKQHGSKYILGAWYIQMNISDRYNVPQYLLLGQTESNTSSKQINITVHKIAEENMKEHCSAEGENLVGGLFVNKTMTHDMEDIEKDFAVSHGGWVEKGGTYRPQHCRPLKKVAIIIPYRKRYEQLKLFLRHMHPILKRQLLDYRIFTVEQNGTTLFNRAILFNIGYNESRRFNSYDCYIFHDIDLLLENDKNMYNCFHSPRHMCPAIDKHKYRLLYGALFGGVEAFQKEHFETINGFSNKFWGWGGEDDDLYKRSRKKGFSISRPAMTIGRYKMVKIFHFAEKHKRNSTRTRNLLRQSRVRMDNDGLNTLKYNLLRTEQHLLYTNLLVEVDRKSV